MVLFILLNNKKRKHKIKNLKISAKDGNSSGFYTKTDLTKRRV